VALGLQQQVIHPTRHRSSSRLPLLTLAARSWFKTGKAWCDENVRSAYSVPDPTDPTKRIEITAAVTRCQYYFGFPSFDEMVSTKG